MEANRLLTVDSDGPSDVVDPGCPKCGEPWGAVGPVEAVAFGGARIRRCGRCGTRATVDESPPRVLRTCDACGLPFLEEAPETPGPRRCDRCVAEASGSPEREVVEATEAEVRGSLDEAWRFVTSPGLSDYLDRVVRETTGPVDGLPAGCRVALLDDPALRTLALPSGAIVVSIGMLRFLEDEAELAFVVGRELAFLASGEAAGRLVRGSFGAVAREGDGGPETAWTDAVDDWMRLGYGRRRELDADARALRTMLDLHYDPGSALRYLRRLQAAIDSGDPHVAEIAVAQPPPAYRIRKLERILYGRVERGDVQRVNREVFRRAARAEGLTRSTLEPPASPEDARATVRPGRLVRVAVAVLGLAALAAGLIALVRLLG